MKLLRIATHLAKEPPFRRLSKAALQLLPITASLRSQWDISKRPQYLLGLVTAAKQARLQGESAFSAIEFGVAGGYGLLSMQQDAKAVSHETGIDIRIFGFDTGTGLPDLLPDYRDHPDIWRPGDYPMDQSRLRSHLDQQSQLVLGDVAETVPRFFTDHQPPPIGFISIDLDLYSASKSALNIFSAPGRKMLWHVPMYLDDVDMFYTHARGGELLAIQEHNQESCDVYIDTWRGVRSFRPFPEAPYLDRMFIAHDLASISRAKLTRAVNQLTF